MASIRDTLLTTLVTRINAISGITCVLRSRSNTVSDAVMAIVYPDSEDTHLANAYAYNASLRCEVLLIVRAEDADPSLDASNEYRYLDRMLVAVQKVIHTPDSWGVSPAFTDVEMTGHVVEDPSEENEMMARLSITFTYRHNYQDPESA